MYKCEYFNITELVSPIIYNKFGESAWMFFDDNVLRDLDCIRKIHGMPITINNYSLGLQQCGLRCNVDNLVKNKKNVYCSAHIMGKAFDLHSKDNKKLFNDIQCLITNKALKSLRRLENPQTTKYEWVHVDAFRTKNNNLEIF